MWSSHFPSGTPSRFSLAFGLTTMVFKISNTDPDHLSTLTLGILCLVSRLFLVYLCWWVPPCLSTSSLLNMLFPSFPALVSPSPTQSFSLTSHSSGGSGPISSPPGEWGVAKAVYVSPIIAVTRMNSKCWFVRFLSPYMTALLESKKDNMLLLQRVCNTLSQGLAAMPECVNIVALWIRPAFYSSWYSQPLARCLHGWCPINACWMDDFWKSAAGWPHYPGFVSTLSHISFREKSKDMHYMATSRWGCGLIQCRWVPCYTEDTMSP